MHSLHFIVVNADSAIEAGHVALAEISHWGNENNWRSIGGVAGLDGLDDVENLQGARWGLSFVDGLPFAEGATNAFEQSLAYIMNMISDPICLDSQPYTQCEDLKGAILTIAQQLADFDPISGEDHALWAASRNLRQLWQLKTSRRAAAAGATFPPYYDWEFDYPGVTDLSDSTDGRQRYIVFLDMHS